MDDKKPTHWETFGKVSAVVAFAATVIGIWGVLFPKSAEIEVHGYHESFALPPDLSEMMKATSVNFRKYGLDDALSEQLEKSQVVLDSASLLAVRDAVSAIFEKSWNGKFSNQIQRYDGFVYLTATNQGESTAKDIVLDLPLSGVALLTSQNEAQNIVDFKKSIKLGELRPKNSISIAIWAEDYRSYIEDHDFSVSFDSGVGSVSLSVKVDGFVKLIEEHRFLASWLLSMVALFLLVSLVQAWASSRALDETVHDNDVAENGGAGSESIKDSEAEK